MSNSSRCSVCERLAESCGSLLCRLNAREKLGYRQRSLTPLGVRDSDHCAFDDFLGLHNEVFHLCGVDPLAAGANDVAGTVVERHKPGVGDCAYVAGTQPAVGSEVCAHVINFFAPEGGSDLARFLRG